MQYLESIKQLLEAAWAMPEVQIIVYHSLVNLVAGITAALATNTFDLGKLWEFFGKKILPFSAMYLVSRLAGDVVLAGVLPAAVFVAIEAALLRDLVDSVAKIPGLSSVVSVLPESVLRSVLKRA